MKPNQEQLEDQLLDALLHEQRRNDREQAYADIEAAIDGAKVFSPLPVRSMWRQCLTIVAACVVFGGLAGLWLNFSEKTVPEMALLETPKSTEQELNSLKTAIREQEDKLEESRKVLRTVSRTKAITYRGEGGTAAYTSELKAPSMRHVEIQSRDSLISTVETEQEAAFVLLDYERLEVEKVQLETQIESLMRYDSEQLLAYASGLDLPDNFIKALYPQYLELKRNVDGLKASGLGEKHPTVQTNQRVLNSMKDQLDEAVVDLRGRLQGQLEMAKERLAKVEPTVDKMDSESYALLIDPTWESPAENPLSTFSIDVDTASYANIRRFIREGRNIPADAVRIEECINAFNYNYEPPAGDRAFAVHTELATCPWNENNLLVKFGIKGREIAREKRPVSNLVFLIDVSGSMQANDKLPLVKESLKLLLHQLDERDSVSYVVYAGSEGVVLPPTKMTESGRVQALQALENLESGGSTNGGAGIKRAYQLASENFIDGGVNRVILASDGDFNVGVTGNDALVSLVKERAAKNIYLSALAFGTGNLNDAMFEAISNDGNGNYFYIDGIRESRKVFLENLTGSLITIAKDVKVQVEFNPGKVGSYRLIGYANRVLADEDFNDDKVDAGDIGAGHTVTAFYEIVPAGASQPNGGGVDALKYQKAEPEAKAAVVASDEWLTLKLRHKHPEGDVSAMQEAVVKGDATAWQEAGADFQFAAGVALFGMKLRGMAVVSEIPWENVKQLARPSLKKDLNEDRAEFIDLIGELERQSR